MSENNDKIIIKNEINELIIYNQEERKNLESMLVGCIKLEKNLIEINTDPYFLDILKDIISCLKALISNLNILKIHLNLYKNDNIRIEVLIEILELNEENKKHISNIFFRNYSKGLDKLKNHQVYLSNKNIMTNISCIEKMKENSEFDYKEFNCKMSIIKEVVENIIKDPNIPYAAKKDGEEAIILFDNSTKLFGIIGSLFLGVVTAGLFMIKYFIKNRN